MPPVGFEPTISAGERPQTYALDRAATGTDVSLVITYKNSTFFPQKIYIICACLRKNNEVFPVQVSPTGFYNRGGKFLLRGTTWAFK